MKVILTRDVPKLGKDGEVLMVANGYARNYLFPRQLAVVAKGSALKQHEQRVVREVEKGKAQVVTAQESAAKIEGKTYQILGKASPRSNRLFGAVTEADVAEAIEKETGVVIDKRRISLVDPIKITGSYDLTARLHSEVTVAFAIEIVTPEQLEAREKARILAEEKAAKEAAALEAANAPAPVEASAEPVAELAAETVEETAMAATDAADDTTDEA